MAMGRISERRDWIGVRWGLPCSALLHSAIVALALLVVPEPRKPKALPREIPVEVVRKAPEKKPPSKPKKEARKTPPKSEKKKPIAKKEPPKPSEKKPTPKEKAILPLEKKAEPKKASPKEKQAPPPGKTTAENTLPNADTEAAKPAGKPSLNPEPRKPAARIPAEEPRTKVKLPLPEPKPPLAAKEPELALGPKPPNLWSEPALRPKPAPPRKPKSGSLIVPPQADAVPHPDAKKRKLLGQWILRPLTLNTGHRCGTQRVTGTMTLTNRRVRGGGSEVLYLAEIRTTIHWERCRPEGVINKFGLLKRGNRVFLLTGLGVTDEGLVEGRVMFLDDSYGRSVWIRSK